jgi:hypothetical protein
MKDGNTYYAVKGGGTRTKAVSIQRIPEKLKELGKSLNSEIIDIKFHNFPEEKLESGSTIYFYEKYKIEKMTGSTL